jgi:hypothetical protein
VGSAVAGAFYSGASRIHANYLLVPQKSLRLLKKKVSVQLLKIFLSASIFILFSYSPFQSNLRLNGVK